MNGFIRAASLEYNYIKERLWSTLLFFASSGLIIFIFSIIAKIPVGWGGFYQMNYTYYDLLAPTIFPLIILFITIQMTVLRIVGERAPYGTLDRELIAIPRVSMYFGKLCVHMIIAFIQCVIVYLFGFIFFPVKSYAMSGVIIILLFFLLALFGLSLGFFISVYSKYKESAIQIVPYIVLALFITSLILIFPGATFSSGIKIIFMSNPVALISQSLSETMINGVGFEDISVNIVKVTFWIAALTVITLLKFKFERK